MSPTTRRGSLATVASTWVRERILSKELVAGAVVRPEDVGRDLGISQTPAREALQSLRTEGFLTSEPGVGFVVAPLTPSDIRDIFTAHAFLSGEIAARAVKNATDTEIDELEAVHYELLAALRRGNSELVEDRNHEFHRQITHLADSPKLSQILGIVARYVPRSFYPAVEGWMDTSASDHDEIIANFRKKDADGARRAMEQHMTNAGTLLAENFS